MKDFYIIIGCDCDPDRPAYGGYDYEANQLSWRGVVEGIPLYLEERKRFFDKNKYSPKVTWFVRADKQIESICGDYASSLEDQKKIWNELESLGDEIALHPHLWDHDGDTWYQKVDSFEFKKEVLQRSVTAFERSRGKVPSSVHAGWCYQDNDTIGLLSELDVQIDCSANPGQNTMDSRIRDRAKWSDSPNVPYKPSLTDYMSHDPHADKKRIWEVPAFSSASKCVSWVRQIKDVFEHQVKKSLKQEKMVPLMTFHPFLFRSLVNRLCEKIDSRYPYFLSYFHADEFLPKKYKKGVFKWSHSLGYFWKNIDFVVSQIKKENYHPQFVTLAEYKVLLDKDHE